MGYSRLTPAQEEQMKKMHAEKKSAKEIIDFFKETYEIKMAPWKVSYICGKKGTGGGRRYGISAEINGAAEKEKDYGKNIRSAYRLPIRADLCFC